MVQGRINQRYDAACVRSEEDVLLWSGSDDNDPNFERLDVPLSIVQFDFLR